MSDNSIGKYGAKEIASAGYDRSQPLKDRARLGRRKVNFKPVGGVQVSLEVVKVGRKRIERQAQELAETLLAAIQVKDPGEFILTVARLSRLPESLRTDAIHRSMKAFGWLESLPDNLTYLSILLDHVSLRKKSWRLCWEQFLCPTWINTRLGTQDGGFPDYLDDAGITRAAEAFPEACFIVQTPLKDIEETKSDGPRKALTVEEHAADLMDHIADRDLQFFVTLAHLSKFPRDERIAAINQALETAITDTETFAHNLHFLGILAWDSTALGGEQLFDTYTQKLVPIWTSTSLMKFRRMKEIKVPAELRPQVVDALRQALAIANAS
jgi:hypothetical protein